MAEAVADTGMGVVKISRRGKPTPFHDYETTVAGGIEKKYIRLGSTQLDHEAFRALTKKSSTAAILYVYMKREAEGKRDFVYPRSKYKDLMGNDTFKRSKDLLIKFGFIEEVENNKHRHIANVYRFSERWKSIDLREL